MQHYTHDDIHDAYLWALQSVWNHSQFKSSPRGQATREILDYAFTITNPVAEPIVTHDAERNSVIADYTKKEWELYDSCTNRVEDFAKASKFWNKLANPDGTVNSAYGYLIWKNKSAGDPMYECWGSSITEKDRRLARRTPWDWCYKSLKEDKDTRQAILRFSLPSHQWRGNKDQTCTMHGNFLIRADKLHLSVIMRSNDLMKGLVYDLPWFISLMDRMIDELKPTYPNLKKGTYTHLSHSMHIYEKDKESIFKMLGIK